jgi:hypothetical protein
MKKFALVLLVIFAAAPVFAVQYENPMLNMTVPSGLDDGYMYLEIGHKFFQSFYKYPSDDFFALLNYGSNISIGMRYMIWQGIEANAAYISYHREKTIGISYTLKTPQIGFNTRFDVQFFNYQDLGPGEPVVQNLFYLVSLQSEPFLDDRVNVSLDAGFDGYEQAPGLGIGVSVETLKHVRVLAEYYPVLKAIGNRTTGCFSAGIKIDTSGHQFIIRIGNSQEIGTKGMMHGAANLDLYGGFEIMRLIVF